EMYPWQPLPMTPQSYAAGQLVTVGLQSVTWIGMKSDTCTADGELPTTLKNHACRLGESTIAVRLAGTPRLALPPARTVGGVITKVSSGRMSTMPNPMVSALPAVTAVVIVKSTELPCGTHWPPAGTATEKSFAPQPGNLKAAMRVSQL